MSGQADLAQGAPGVGVVAGAAPAPLTRPDLFAGLTVLGFLNGISEKVYRSVIDFGAAGAALQTFDVSLILWGACVAAVVLLLKADRAEPIGRRDLAVACLACLAFFLPVPAASWLGLCLLGWHLWATAREETVRRAAAIIVALTIPLFWARLLFAALSDTILHIDASLVGWVIGTVPTGNVVPLADGSGSLFFAPGCSSVANLSLALLSAAVFVNLRSGRWSPAFVAWAVASAAGVVALNVGRISLIGLFPERYDLIHGPVGAAVDGWLTLGVILLVGYHRIGRDAPHGR